jgi:hypothetical protein
MRFIARGRAGKMVCKAGKAGVSPAMQRNHFPRGTLFLPWFTTPGRQPIGLAKGSLPTGRCSWAERLARPGYVRQGPAKAGNSSLGGWPTGPGKARQNLTRAGQGSPAKTGTTRPAVARRPCPCVHRWLARLALPGNSRQEAASNGSSRRFSCAAGTRYGNWSTGTCMVVLAVR